MKTESAADIAQDLAKLEAFALEKGAVKAVRIPIDKVVVDERVYYKCLYGCPSVGSSKMCPPNTPLPRDFERALRKFEWGILVQTRPRDITDMVVAVEREAFLLGHYLALGLKGGSCFLCSECTGDDEPCRYPDKARPSMEALGIDVFATLKNVDIPAAVMTDGEQEWFFHGLIMVG
jgi:predicted metal-binding protein